MKTLFQFNFLIIFFGLCYQSHAQDGHYWSENYGNRSMLLSGTVNASVDDLGAVFYNPGRLGIIESPAFVISAKVYEWSTIRIKDGLGDGVDLNKSSFGGAPSLVAGTFSIPFLKEHKFAYSFLTRQLTDADFFVRVEEEDAEFTNIPGKVLFNGKLNINTSYREEWFGLTWSPPITEKFSVGLSNFVTTVNRSASTDLDMKTLDENNMIASLSANRQYGYETYGLLWKLGIAWDLSPVNLGLTVTTPKVNLRGSGSSLYEQYLIGVDTSGNGINDDIYIFNTQKDLDATYYSPWAIGFGLGIHFKKAIVHLSAEWYDKVPQYTILETDPFLTQISGEPMKFTLVDELKSVINYGLGLEMNLNEKISIYASIATNYSSVTSDITRFAELEEEANNSVFQADFLKFGSGFTLNTSWAEVTLGATYSGASQEIKRPIDFSGDQPVLDSDAPATITFKEWRFILGFSFPFAEKIQKNMEGEPEE
jgi:hypothetical protein